MTLKHFSSPEQLSHVHRNLLMRLLDDYKEYLPADAAALLPAQIDFEQFCASWAAQFKSPSRFGAPLRDALLAIDDLARPENESLLKDAVAHLPPGYVNRNQSPLHQSLHLWLIAQNTPGVSWPSGAQASACSNVEKLSSIDGPSASAISTCNMPPAPCNIPKQVLPSQLLQAEACAPGTAGAIESNGSVAAGDSGPVPALENPPASELLQAEACAPGTAGAIESNGSVAAGDNGRTPALENQNSKIKNSIGPSSPFAQDINSLALLPAVEYDLVRRAEAKRLNLRLSTLDDAVERARILEADAQANALKLPQLEPWPEPITDAPALFDEVHDRCLLYLHLPPGTSVVLTLWPAHASAIKAFTLTPRLNFTSVEPGCGKTTALDFLATLCPNVLRTDNLKTAVLFRVVEQQQPTLLLDELDSYLHLYPDLRGLINSGHSDSGYAHRCEGNKVRAFRSFAATALAGIGELANTLRDRSIAIRLVKAPPGVLKARFDKRHVETETMLGRKIARWVQDNFAAIADCEPIMPPAAHNRLGDNWRPLFAIAQLIGGHWPQRILDAFTDLKPVTVQPINSSPTSPAGTLSPTSEQSGFTIQTSQLLSDLRSIFAQSGTDRLLSSFLVKSLRALPNRPWSGTNNGDQPITQTILAAHLSAFGIRPKLIRIAPHRGKGYLLSDLTPAFTQILDTR